LTGGLTASDPLVSLLIPNRDTEAVLDLTMERLAANTTYPRVEVVVVDDGSSDGSLDILRRWRDSGRFPAFKLIEREPEGVVKALNAGLEAASGEVVVQLDSDATVETPGWVERMLGMLLLDDAVGVVTGEVVFDFGLIQACGVNIVAPEGAHDRPTRITERAGHRRWHQRVRRYAEGTRSEETAVAEVDSGIGCCMMYRRSDAAAAGGYDTEFSPLWFDDLDLCVAIRGLGKKVFYVPGVRVVHRFGMRKRRPIEPHGVADWVAQRAWRIGVGVAGGIPPAARESVKRRTRLDRPRPEHRARLEHHYAYWERKWGWHPLNPDMAAVRRRHGDSEICWALDSERVSAGRRIAERFAGEREPGL
jgi:GT2 family glycosyltransferase